MKYIKILLLSFFVISSYSYAQETEVEAPTNLDKLLELVKEGKSKGESIDSIVKDIDVKLPGNRTVSYTHLTLPTISDV